jgi:hypothetical protein
LGLALSNASGGVLPSNRVRRRDKTGATETDLAAAVLRHFGGRMIPTMPLAALIAYKRVIGRHNDVANLERLERLQAGGA